MFTMSPCACDFIMGTMRLEMSTKPKTLVAKSDRMASTSRLPISAP